MVWKYVNIFMIAILFKVISIFHYSMLFHGHASFAEVLSKPLYSSNDICHFILEWLRPSDALWWLCTMYL